MLCSLSTTSAGKSTAGLSWLDRLRISRGFPLHHPDLDLDHFLLHPSNPSPNSILPSPPPHQPEDASPTLTDSHSREITDDQSPGKGNQGYDEEDEEKEKGEFFNLMSNALADLFRMDPAEHKRIRDLKDRRNWRKQLNPKICVLPTSGGDGGTLSPPSAENSTVGAKKRLAGRKTLGKKRAFSNNGSKGPELEQQSRTEVTVIDTSCSPEWKSEKILFRKGNIWKIRDRISWNLSKRKKRKLNSAERLTGGEENDQKYNEVDRNDALTAVREHPHEPVSKGSILDNNFAPQRRLHLSRSSHKPAIRDITISRPRKIPCKKRRNLPTEVALNCQ